MDDQKDEHEFVLSKIVILDAMSLKWMTFEEIKERLCEEYNLDIENFPDSQLKYWLISLWAAQLLQRGKNSKKVKIFRKNGHRAPPPRKTALDWLKGVVKA